MLGDRVILRSGEFYLIRDGRCFVFRETRIPHIYTFEEDGKIKKCFFFM